MQRLPLVAGNIAAVTTSTCGSAEIAGAPGSDNKKLNHQHPPVVHFHFTSGFRNPPLSFVEQIFASSDSLWFCCGQNIRGKTYVAESFWSYYGLSNKQTM